MIWRNSEGSTIAEYNDQFMNQEMFTEACSGTFKLSRVFDIVLKDKQSGFVVSQMDTTDKKALKNEVHERVPAIIFIENSNRRIYYELLNTLEKDYFMGQDN